MDLTCLFFYLFTSVVFACVSLPVCVCLCVCVQDSFQTLKKWVKELKEHGPENIVVAIAGNKNDLGDIR